MNIIIMKNYELLVRRFDSIHLIQANIQRWGHEGPILLSCFVYVRGIIGVGTIQSAFKTYSLKE